MKPFYFLVSASALRSAVVLMIAACYACAADSFFFPATDSPDASKALEGLNKSWGTTQEKYTIRRPKIPNINYAALAKPNRIASDLHLDASTEAVLNAVAENGKVRANCKLIDFSYLQYLYDAAHFLNIQDPGHQHRGFMVNMSNAIITSLGSGDGEQYIYGISALRHIDSMLAESALFRGEDDITPVVDRTVWLSKSMTAMIAMDDPGTPHDDGREQFLQTRTSSLTLAAKAVEKSDAGGLVSVCGELQRIKSLEPLALCRLAATSLIRRKVYLSFLNMTGMDGMALQGIKTEQKEITVGDVKVKVVAVSDEGIVGLFRGEIESEMRIAEKRGYCLGEFVMAWPVASIPPKFIEVKPKAP